MLPIVAPDQEDVPRPDEPWKYPYVAAVLDFGSNIRIMIRKDDSYAVGYQIAPTIGISSSDPTAMGFLDDFCRTNGVQFSIHDRERERGTTYRLDINRRESIDRFLRLVYPYLVVRYEVATIMLEDLLPGLEENLHGSEEGFIELMEHVDTIRDDTRSRSDAKYSADWFREEWGV